MKKTLPFSFLLSLCTLYAQDAQAHSHTYIIEQPAPTYVVVQPQAPAAVVMVESAPPAEINEEMGVCPGANYVWIKGHWQWDGCRWYRVHGHWVVRPHASAVWVPGCWTEHHHHWRWSEGYWQ